MNNIRINGLRSLIDTGDISIKPLTILVGKNGTGKSTFLRSFPLLKQSVNSDTREPIRWYERDIVDFGSFSESITFDSKDKVEEMKFSFEIPFPKSINLLESFYLSNFYFYEENSNETTKSNDKLLNVSLSLKAKEKESEINQVKIKLDNYTLLIDYSANKLSLIENGKEYFYRSFQARHNYRRALIPEIFVKTNKDKASKYNIEFEKFIKWIKNDINRNLKDETIVNSLKNFNLDTKSGFVKQIKEQLDKENTRKTLREYYESLLSNENKLDEFISKYILCTIEPIIRYTNKKLYSIFTDVNYIAPVRASAERYYRVQGLSLDTIDPQGQNVAEYLNHLKNNFRKNEKWMKWTRKNFGFEFSVQSNYGHIGIYVTDNDSKHKVNLADTGFGYSQILPILIQLWQAVETEKRFYNKTSNSPLIIAIEQPELHLHPGFQAKLMDAFINCIKICNDKNIDLRIVLETHSETMLNRIGRKIALSEQRFDNLVNVLLFEKNDSNHSTIKTTKFAKEGYLKEWPVGFFGPEGN